MLVSMHWVADDVDLARCQMRDIEIVREKGKSALRPKKKEETWP